MKLLTCVQHVEVVCIVDIFAKVFVHSHPDSNTQDGTAQQLKYDKDVRVTMTTVTVQTS